MRKNILFLFLIVLLNTIPVSIFASPIYVYKEHNGDIRFTSKKPLDAIEDENFYSLNKKYIYKPIQFSTWEDAKNYVRTHYKAEVCDTSRSSWIRGAEYYYASGQGFLILNMKGKDYIFKGVPLEIWNGFKNAASFGQYYNQYIRGRYYFNLNN